MKKILVTIAIFLFVIGVSYSFNLTIAFPEYLHASTSYTVPIKVNSTEKFDVVILLPKDFKYQSQNINTSELNYWFESKKYSYKGTEWIGLHWHVEHGGTFLINFTFTTPNVNRLDKYEVIYTTENGEFGEKVKLIRIYTGNAPPPICGNGVCEPGENFITCPGDCGGVKSYVTDILIIVGATLGSASILIWYLKKKEFESSIMSMYNVDKLIVYIRSALDSNIPEWKIKENLYKMGWEPKVVDFLINKLKREKK